jgi:Fur family ferric uptake transcriptional regulator/Fur family peroxide stress response transcriptional regulator
VTGELLALTPQRRAVLDVVAAADDHPTAAEVLDRVRELVPGVGPATVYRTLALLVDSGQVAEVRMGHGAARYDRTTGHHDHLVCDDCGGVEDVRAPLQRGALAAVAAASSFAVSGYDLRIHGRCRSCSSTPTSP